MMDSGSLFHFPRPTAKKKDFGFISSSHTATGRFLRCMTKRLMPTRQWIHYILRPIRQTSGLTKNPDSNPGSLLLEISALVEVSTLWVQSSFCYFSSVDLCEPYRLNCVVVNFQRMLKSAILSLDTTAQKWRRVADTILTWWRWSQM